MSDIHNQREIENLQAENERLRAEIKRLRSALKPFAKAAENFDTLKAFQDPEQFFAYSGIRSKRGVGVKGAISVADLRLARAALEGDK